MIFIQEKKTYTFILLGIRTNKKDLHILGGCKIFHSTEVKLQLIHTGYLECFMLTARRDNMGHAS